MERDHLVGSWKLSSFEAHSPDGHLSHPMGENASGLLIYTATRRMSVQLMRRDRPHFAAGNRLQGTPEEIKAAFEGFVGYWGTFDVDEKAKTVTHHVAGASFPNWIGTDQKRFYEFDRDRLTLSTPLITAGGV